MHLEEDDWQRSTDHPTARALVGFLEADLDRGMTVAWQIETDAKAGRPAPDALLAQIGQIHLEVERLRARAAERRIPVDHLRSRLAQFDQALEHLRERNRHQRRAS